MKIRDRRQQKVCLKCGKKIEHNNFWIFVMKWGIQIIRFCGDDCAEQFKQEAKDYILINL